MRKLPQTIDYRAEFLEQIGSLDDFVTQPLDQHGDEFVESLRSTDEPEGLLLPWGKTGDVFRLRTSEVTLWPGYNGSGKSALIGQVMTHLAMGGTPVLVASFEMPIKRLLERHCSQIEGRLLRAGQEARFWEIMAMTEETYWVYTQSSHMDPERVLGMISYSAREHGIKHFVIDSLVKCGVSRAPDHTENLEKFVDALQILAKRYDIAIHLVMHLRKPADHSRIPSKWDVKYAGEMTDLADNVVLVWRNKLKERGEDADIVYDTLIIVDKQRNFSWEGDIGLYYDRQSGSWSETPKVDQQT